ncbi:MAG: class II aldolase/adducin family protein [Alphaproteobacteria bacterium]|nr:class II aldolase/adducin family protein [Alphaproteobacteria bacterium]
MSAVTDETGLRAALTAALRRLDRLGLNRGSTGNLSHRCSVDGRAGMLITPTGMGADDMQPGDWVWLGDDGSQVGAWEPSSEWAIHRAIYQDRPELQAVVHTHSVNATAVACLRRDLPPFHYMVAVAGGDSVRCAPYHLFGSQALSAAVVEAMQGRLACLLANHGLVAAAATLAQAVKVAQEIEALCEVYLKALAVGQPAILDADAMAEVLERFSRYGQTSRR